MTTYQHPDPNRDETLAQAQDKLYDAGLKSVTALNYRLRADEAARAGHGRTAAELLRTANRLEAEAAQLREEARALVRGDRYLRED